MPPESWFDHAFLEGVVPVCDRISGEDPDLWAQVKSESRQGDLPLPVVNRSTHPSRQVPRKDYYRAACDARTYAPSHADALGHVLLRSGVAERLQNEAVFMLDIGCGIGNGLAALLDTVPAIRAIEYTGIEPHVGMRNLATRYFLPQLQESGCTASVRSTVETIDSGDSTFGLVVLSYVTHQRGFQERHCRQTVDAAASLARDIPTVVVVVTANSSNKEFVKRDKRPLLRSLIEQSGLNLGRGTQHSQTARVDLRFWEGGGWRHRAPGQTAAYENISWDCWYVQTR